MIIVNAREIEYTEPTIDYSKLIDLAGKINHSQVFTVTYSIRGTNYGGSLTMNDKPIEVSDGMIFNVALTNNS